MLALLALVDAVTREAMLFAAVGFLIGGTDDLAVDLIYLARTWRRYAAGESGAPAIAELPRVAPLPPLAVFVPAWDESAVIGAMLQTALARFRYPAFRIYVGCYPNDRATIDAVAAIAARDARLRLVVGPRPGPTTKADCLNALWHQLGRDDAAEGQRTRAVVLHDAEDVVHADELRVFGTLVAEHAVVQLPVLPLVPRRSRFIAGHYADEFAEAHAKLMVVRELIGAALPLAGVGCAIATDVLERIAARNGGDPFDGTCLTEDYELGLQAAALGGSGVFARYDEYPGGPPVAVRAYFPETLHAAVVQKARWMVGIALAGWDRVGWGPAAHVAEHWMRMRDRRAPIAVIVLAAAYLALLGWGASQAGHWIDGSMAPPIGGWLGVLLGVNAVLLAWRMALRVVFTAAAYGWREAPFALPRVLVGNLIALLAARRAMMRYLGLLRGRALSWDKTSHAFPRGSDLR